MKYFFLSSLFIIGTINFSFGQKLEHRLGEVIVELEEGKEFHSLTGELSTFRGKKTDVTIKQITKVPMNLWKVKIDHENINELDFADNLREIRSVRTVIKNFISQYRRIPNDPLFDLQWPFINSVEGIDTDADLAWDITTGGMTISGDTIVICVIDNGIDSTHQDFADNLWINYNEIPDNNIDDDNNGYVDDYYGWHISEGDDDVFRIGDHGTSVSGIIGAQGNNMIGVTGVNWNIKIMHVVGGNDLANALSSYEYPYTMRQLYNETNGEKGVFVVATNASWGFNNKFANEAPLLCSFYDELGQIGITNVAATANSSIDVELQGDLPTTCPSPHLITVTNLQRDGTKRISAGYGQLSIDLAAPGDDVYTTSKDNNYSRFNGTSGSSPHVAGTIGLMYATSCGYLSDLAISNPGDASLLVKNIILGTVTENDAMAGLTVTEGHLNIGNAVITSSDLCDSCPFPVGVEYVPSVDGITLLWDKEKYTEIGIRYRQKGKNQWQNDSASSSPYEISGLQSCTNYEIQLRSNCEENGPYGYVSYVKTDNCCELPDKIEILSNGNDLIVSWDAITAARSYEISYKEIDNKEWQNAVINTNNFTIEGITSCAGFQFRLKTICSSEITEFSEIFYDAVNCAICNSENYCTDLFTDNTYEYIEKIVVDNLVNQSGKDVAGYGQYLGSYHTWLTQGIKVPVSIVPGFPDNDSFSEYFAIYIDFNQNFIFEESERIFSDVGSSEVTGDITIPHNAIPGTTRMRVIMSYDAINGPCASDKIEFGEVEDYCITIQSSQPCNIKPGIDEYFTTSTKISLIWSEVETSENYTLNYRLLGDEDWITVESETSSLEVSNLTPCSNYEFRVKANCDGASYSDIVKIATRCTTGTIDFSPTKDIIDVYPNPFSNQLQISFPELKNISDINMSILDMSGKIITSRKYKLNPKEVINISDLSPLPSGVYYLQVLLNKQVSFKKIVKI